MSLENGRRGNWGKYIQLIHLVRTECHACTLYWNIVHWRDFRPIPTGLAVCIWCNHFLCLPFCGLFCTKLIHLWRNAACTSCISVLKTNPVYRVPPMMNNQNKNGQRHLHLRNKTRQNNKYDKVPQGGLCSLVWRETPKTLPTIYIEKTTTIKVEQKS